MKQILLSTGKYPNKVSKVRGVTFHKKRGTWLARAYVNGKRACFGYYKTIAEAEAALIAARGPIVPKGISVIVSDEDYEFLSQFNWHLSPSGYAVRNIKKGLPQKLMHRDIAERMGLDLTKQVDHRNANRLDNSRENLRSASQSENNANNRLRQDSTSRVKGVCWDKSKKKWYARITMNKKTAWWGRFDSLEEAAMQRAQNLPIYHGEYARC